MIYIKYNLNTVLGIILSPVCKLSMCDISSANESNATMN